MKTLWCNYEFIKCSKCAGKIPRNSRYFVNNEDKVYCNACAISGRRTKYINLVTIDEDKG